MFSGSYDRADVTFLLKPIALTPTDVADKEALIQSGRRHYSEMLSPETPPGDEYIALYRAALARNGARLAQDIVNLAAMLDARSASREEIVLASLVRAGTPIGILLARALRRMGRKVAHYSVSIIRDRGVDAQALTYIAARHDPADTVFVDGWTGKGAIATELQISLRGTAFAPVLAVVADPAGCADFAATNEDYLIASGLLNSIVSGLVSRSILNADFVGPGDFHACVYYAEHARSDLSQAFVDEIDALSSVAVPQRLEVNTTQRAALRGESNMLVTHLMAVTKTDDRNRIKPGIAEATRALLRRLPDQLFIRDLDDPDVAHLRFLAETKGVRCSVMPQLGRYRAAVVIKTLGRTKG